LRTCVDAPPFNPSRRGKGRRDLHDIPNLGNERGKCDRAVKRKKRAAKSISRVRNPESVWFTGCWKKNFGKIGKVSFCINTKDLGRKN